MTDNGREKAVYALEKGATALLCVDGVFHMRCTQPVISLMQAGTTKRVSRTLHVETRREVVEGMPKVGKSNAILPLDQWDEAVDMVVRESRDRRETFRRLSRLRPVLHRAHSSSDVKPTLNTTQALELSSTIASHCAAQPPQEAMLGPGLGNSYFWP